MIHELILKMNKMAANIILQEAVRKFGNITGGNARYKGGTSGNDGNLVISIGKQKHDFHINIKNELRQSNLPALIEQVGKEKEDWLIISKYIPKPLKEKLKGEGINYLEAAGNCFIQAGALFLYINDQPVTPTRETVTGKLWKQSGLKFLFVILCDNTLLNAPYRKIAEVAGIALGNIGSLLEELRQAGYIIENENGFCLTQKEQLTQRWMELFHAVLRPRLIKGVFRFARKEREQEWKEIKSENFLWGAEPAGDMLTGFLPPKTFTVYSSQAVNDVVKELRLIPDPAGNVILIEQFWQELLSGNTVKTVPPLLVYAELMVSHDSRNWEVASRIKNKYLNA